MRTPSPKHRAHTPLDSTVSGSESEGEEDRREVIYVDWMHAIVYFYVLFKHQWNKSEKVTV